MNTAVRAQKEIYREVNGITGTVNSVIFGTKSLAELPVAELVQDFGLNISVCNRSVEEAVLADAFDLLDECVYALQPRKVFLSFGDTDLDRANFNSKAFLADYQRLIEAIQANCDCRLFMISVLSEGEQADQLNLQMCRLAEKMGAHFLDASDILRCEKPGLRLFSKLIHHMREGRLSFADAMHLCNA